MVAILNDVKRHRRTPARAKVLPHLAKAVAENWTAQKLASTAHVHNVTAARELGSIYNASRSRLDVSLGHSLNRLSSMARKAREAEIVACDGVLRHILKLDSQIARSQDVDAFELEKLINIRAKYAQHVERVTGMDVIKAIAIRTAVDKSGNALSWDGIASLEAAQTLSLPAPASPSLSDLW